MGTTTATEASRLLDSSDGQNRPWWIFSFGETEQDRYSVS